MGRLLVGAAIGVLAVSMAVSAHAQQLPEPLIKQMQALAALYGDARSREDPENRSYIEVPRATHGDVVVALFRIVRLERAPHTRQYLAVFAPYPGQAGARGFRLVDAMPAGGESWRAVDSLTAARVRVDASTGEVALAIPALANTPTDRSEFPSRKTTVHFRFANERLFERSE